MNRPEGEAEHVANAPDELDPNHLLTTKGVESQVLECGERAGHILLSDYDNGVEHDTLKEEMNELDGISLLFESSPGAYHLWNLTVRSKEQTALRQLDLRGADAKHVAIGWRYGKWTLRTAPKTDMNGEDHKSAPELVRMWYNETNRGQSLPHYRFARALHDIPPAPFEDSVTWRGEAFSLSDYRTVTEELKKEVWDDG